MNILATEPTSIAKVLDTSVKLYAASFCRLWGILSILAVLEISMSLLTQKLKRDPLDSTTVAIEFPAENIPLLGGIFILLALTFVLYAAILYRLDNVANERVDSFFEAITVGFKTFPSIFFSSILYIIAMVVGLILLIVPGTILMMSLSFYLYFIVIDGFGGYAALKASHALVWGHWWRTSAIFTVPMVLWIVVIFTFGFLMAILAVGNQDLIDIAINLSSVFFTPYFFALGYVQFEDLKLRKSGSDLASRLAR
jgi:hypothetical protein